MTAWWGALDLIHQIFYLIALPFTVILVLQTILLLFGLGHDGDADIDHDFDHDLDHDMDHDFDHDAGHDGIGAQHVAGLRMLSLRGIVSFMAVCGWVGILMLDLGAGTGLSILVAVVAGLLAMLLVAWFMLMMTRLQQSGNLDVHNAVGQTGEVYIPIRPGQRGKVTVMVQERLVELDAISTGETLTTGQQIRVTRVTDDGVLVVEAVKE